jgi:SAM-dependent methyltransferase
MSNGGSRDKGLHGEEIAEGGAIDLSIPNVARIYDYYLGGKDNYACDREVARLVLRAAPDIPLAALGNREFVKRAIEFLVTEAGIDQFIDIGPGLPTQANVHELVHGHNPDAHVVYVDNDPVVLSHGRALLQRVAGVAVVEGDVRKPGTILRNPELRALIDFSRPVVVCMSLVLHFIPDADNPWALVARIRDGLPPGSYLVLTHVTGDERTVDIITEVRGMYDDATAPLVPRTRDEFTQFFEGFEVIEPGVVFLSQWRPTNEHYARGGTRWAYAAVGRKDQESQPLRAVQA